MLRKNVPPLARGTQAGRSVATEGFKGNLPLVPWGCRGIVVFLSKTWRGRVATSSGASPTSDRICQRRQEKAENLSGRGTRRSLWQKNAKNLSGGGSGRSLWQEKAENLSGCGSGRSFWQEKTRKPVRMWHQTLFLAGKSRKPVRRQQTMAERTGFLIYKPATRLYKPATR